MVRALFMKDVRLVKKNLLIMLVMIIGMPVFLNWRLDAQIDVGAVPLLMIVNILEIFVRKRKNIPEVKLYFYVRPVQRKYWWL